MPRFCLLLLAASLLVPEPLAAQDPEKVTGVVKQLDAEIGTVTVLPSRKGATEEESYNLLKRDIPVTLPSGEKAQLDAVKPGQTAQLIIGLTGDVEAILIQPSVFTATVKAVDPSARKMTLAGEGILSETIAVAPDAKIWLVERPAFLREIKLGSEITVTSSLDGKTALGLNVARDPDGKLAGKLYPRVKKSRLPGDRFIGVLTDVDAANRELHLSGSKTKNRPKAMPVARDAVLQVLHGEVPLQTVTLDQVVKLARATVMVSPETQQVTHVLVEPPVLRGKVKTLDGDGGKLVVEVDGQARTFELGRNLKIKYGSRVKRLMDLQPNLAVTLVLSLDREQLLAVDTRPVE
jgi:Cu/Ag efflux protein CusF